MTYRLTGSTKLTPFEGEDNDFGQWGISNGAVFGSVTAFENPIASATPAELAITRLRLFDNAVDLGLDFKGFGASNVEQQIIGNGQSFSYASASDTQKSYLQSIIGQSLALQVGSGADPIQVVAAVPEPASVMVWVLGGLACLGFSFRKRSKLVACLAPHPSGH